MLFMSYFYVTKWLSLHRWKRDTTRSGPLNLNAESCRHGRGEGPRGKLGKSYSKGGRGVVSFGKELNLKIVALCNQINFCRAA